VTDFARYDDVGNIVAVGTIPEEMLEQQRGNVIAAKANPATQYISNGMVCDYTLSELTTKNNMSPGWAWKMPERVAIDSRTDDQRAADNLAAILNARRVAYPAYATFADAMYWSARGDSSKLDAYYAHIDAVKAANPKP
jgi:hypothetical protein